MSDEAREERLDQLAEALANLAIAQIESNRDTSLTSNGGCATPTTGGLSDGG